MTARRDHVDAQAAAIMVLLCALWGGQQVAIKVAAADGLAPLVQAGLRSVAAATLIALFVAVRGGAAGLRDLLARDAALAPGLVIAAMFALEFGLLYPGLKLTTASRAVVFLYTAPFFTAAGAHLFLQAERLGARQFAGLLLAFAGVAAAFAEGFSHPGGSIAGDLLCLGAGAAWGATTVVVKANPALARATASRVLFLQLAGSAPPLLLAAALLGPWQAAATPRAWVLLGYQSLIASASFLAWFWLVLRYPAARLAGFTFLTPVFGILCGWAFLDERPGPALLLGVATIAVGLRLLNARPAALPRAARHTI